MSDMSDPGGGLPVGDGALPDPMSITNAQGPLAGRVTKLTPEQREAAEADRQVWQAEAERMTEMLVAAGEDRNEARMMLGLEPIISGPDDDPRPWVTYHVPKEDDEKLDLSGASPDLLEAISQLLEQNKVPLATKRKLTECTVCGDLTGDIKNHMDTVHQVSLLDTGEEDEQLSDGPAVPDRFTTPEAPGRGSHVRGGLPPERDEDGEPDEHHRNSEEEPPEPA